MVVLGVGQVIRVVAVRFLVDQVEAEGLLNLMVTQFP
jgi:hypothetical protein